jgi:hypothetical protein
MLYIEITNLTFGRSDWLFLHIAYLSFVYTEDVAYVRLYAMRVRAALTCSSGQPCAARRRAQVVSRWLWALGKSAFCH